MSSTLHHSLSFHFTLNGKWGIALPCPKILADACAGGLGSKIFCWDKLYHTRYMQSVQSVVVQVSPGKTNTANRRSNAAKMDNVLLLHYSWAQCCINRAILLWVPKWQGMGSGMCFIESSTFCLEQTQRSQSPSFFSGEMLRYLKRCLQSFGSIHKHCRSLGLCLAGDCAKYKDLLPMLHMHAIPYSTSK